MPQISKSVIEGYRVYLQLERSMSPNTVEAYMHDLNTLLEYLETSSLRGELLWFLASDAF